MAVDILAGESISSLSTYVTTIGFSIVRIATVFVMLPLFSNQLIPALVRNSIFVGLAIVTVTIHFETVGAIAPFMWIGLFFKEVFLGIAIGFLLGIYLWAFEAAGMIIDTQVGISQAQILDPISGHETTLFGEFLGRLANYVFLAAGGLMLLVGAIFESFILWPIGQELSAVSFSYAELFATGFSNFFVLTLLIASPILVVSFLIDTLMGLMNRYAQQFNVSFLSMPIKMLAASTLLISTVFMLADLLVAELMKHMGNFPAILQAIFKSN